MAFGDRSKQMADKQKARENQDGEKKEIFVSYYTVKGPGVHTFRWLPEIDKDRKPILTPRLSAAGTELRAGNKKNGSVLMGMVPAEETVFWAAWWKVKVNDTEVSRRLIVANTEQEFWNNPLRKYIKENFSEKAPERTAIKNLFVSNVYDTNMVKLDSQGKVVYQSDSGKFDLSAYGPNGKIITNLDYLPDEDAEPFQLNQVRVLEGSYGKENGRHLFQQFRDLMNDVEDPKSEEGAILRLPEFMLRIKTTGSGLDTKYALKQTNDLTPPSNEVVALPRYNLEPWTRAWPFDAITELLEGRDYNDVVDQYEIVTAPVLETLTEQESLFDE